MITFTYQPALRPALPCIYGPLDYREQRTLFQRIDSILSASGLEEEFIMLTLTERGIDTHSATAARLERFAKYSVLALWTNIARTLMKATTLIRKHGLKHRMPQEPLAFLSDMDTLCMKMTAKSHAADGRKHRKKVLREMKDLEKRIAAHARAHVTILKTRREETDLSEPQAQLIITRIDHVLEQLPAAVKQAHERIIGGRRVANEDKILSLYDDQINVIKRGKAGAQVEFGNKLWLGETREGIIIDYQFSQRLRASATAGRLGGSHPQPLGCSAHGGG